jgi:hypothetical protein
MEKKTFFHFKLYNVAIHVVNFLEAFCTCFPSSLLRQDPILDNVKNHFFFIFSF